MLKNGKPICGDALLTFGVLEILRFSTKLTLQILSKEIVEIATSSRHFLQSQNILKELKVSSSPKKLMILAVMQCAFL